MLSYAVVLGFVAFVVFVGFSLNRAGGGREVIEVTTAQNASGDEGGTSRSRQFELVTLLGFDSIRSIEDPVMLNREAADRLYEPDELVLGIDINGDTRAYSVPLLSRHEIVNDVVGGKPVAITW